MLYAYYVITYAEFTRIKEKKCKIKLHSNKKLLLWINKQKWNITLLLKIAGPLKLTRKKRLPKVRNCGKQDTRLLLNSFVAKTISARDINQDILEFVWLINSMHYF